MTTITSDVDEPLWDIHELSAHLNVPVKTIRKWRETQGGPRARKVGGRLLRWRPSDVRMWEEQC